jgi:hypothetical protein
MFVLKSEHTKMIDELEADVKHANALLSHYKKQEQDKRELDVQTATFEIDFKAIRAFAIERNVHDDKVCTIIGYLDKDNDVREWYFYCSKAQHEQLVAKFREYFGGSKNGSKPKEKSK